MCAYGIVKSHFLLYIKNFDLKQYCVRMQGFYYENIIELVE